ncbi:hypothetical protein QUH71_26905 (plasmid) [Priestia aryabhattai]|uniref:hypothetical protein n=1 Tax=Priestia aryabhattai TaxID=412384 RepID=UPI0025A4A47F|nr:hypothetical protein [Priestia aryabhattai]WJN47597.1 hypothetical protein QUH71_26905 [Priestia aryabhattai]
MINLIVAQVQPNQSLEEATKKADELEKQISSLQDTLISAQNNKISSLIGDIGAIVGIFGIIFTLLSLVSAVAIIYIQNQTKKAKETMEEAKDLAEQARQLNQTGNDINRDAANELKEVKNKMKDLDSLMNFTKNQSLAYTKIDQCRSILKMTDEYIDTKTYTVDNPVLLSGEELESLQTYKLRKTHISERIDTCNNILNSIVNGFYENHKNQEKEESVKNTKQSLVIVTKDIKKLYSSSSEFFDDTKDFHDGILQKTYSIKELDENGE